VGLHTRLPRVGSVRVGGASESGRKEKCRGGRHPSRGGYAAGRPHGGVRLEVFWDTLSCRNAAPLTHSTPCFGTPSAVATQLHSHNTVFWDTTSCRNAAPLTLTQHRVLGHPQLSQRSSTHSHNIVFWDTTSCRKAAPAVRTAGAAAAAASAVARRPARWHTPAEMLASSVSPLAPPAASALHAACQILPLPIFANDFNSKATWDSI
jgi:hypothetical protein